ncbi:MAG: protoporphyrinogen oxidase [Planctomycetes bacterium]|nr:protoporphyrinogen oxidase [Planctomycetota bacterium]
MIQSVHEPERFDTLVVGAGIAGLAYAHALGPNADVVVLEASERVGGVMRTVASSSVAGVRWELGPEAVSDDAPATLELGRELGVEFVVVPENARKRFVVHEGALHELPMTLGALLRTELVGGRAKLFALGERLRPKGAGLDGSLWDFAAARLGPELADALADPVAAGIWCSDAKKLSLRANLPQLAAMVERHGSLTSALLARRGPPPAPIRPKGGWGALPAALAGKLGPRVRLARPVRSLEHVGTRWRATLDGAAIEARRVVLATPAAAAAELVTPFAPELAAELSAIVHESLAAITHVWPRASVAHPLDGFGYLVSRGERDLQISTQFSTSIDPTSAPAGTVVLRTRVGGARNPLAAELSDDDLAAVVMYEVAPLLGLTGDPLLLATTRSPKVLPRYDLDHPRRVQTIDAMVSVLPGFELVGNYLRGAGVNAIVADARARAHA